MVEKSPSQPKTLTVETISIFDLIKIGVGPSSSHTLGPWKAARMCLDTFTQTYPLESIQEIDVLLYGSLAKTGIGHGTDIAILMGLQGEDYESIDTDSISPKVKTIETKHQIHLLGQKYIPFKPFQNIQFLFTESLVFHPNGIRFLIQTAEDLHTYTYYSVGGGFVVQEGTESNNNHPISVPFPIINATDILSFTQQKKVSIADLVKKNELSWRSYEAINDRLLKLWQTMLAAIYKGCHTQGILPGGLDVKRRAADINQKKLQGITYSDIESWLKAIQLSTSFQNILSWVSCFALSVNEENASFGRIVTAPTNGAAGVIPAVLMYGVCFQSFQTKQIQDFLLIAGQIGILFKQKATISAAMGGCQAEIGVSSAMAAAALTECLGGSPAQALMAAEIAMEHHLGMTCDPIKGLVQIPCIERNTMGAIKAITASNLALESDPKAARISLDVVIESMWETAKDMNHKYKETAEGGLASVHISVNMPEC